MILAGALVTNAAASPGDLVQIVVPAGFEGPTSADPGPGAHIDGYVRHIPGQERGTLLQITTYDFGSKLKDMPKEELADAAEHYLLQFLGGVERKRTGFHASKPLAFPWEKSRPHALNGPVQPRVRRCLASCTA